MFNLLTRWLTGDEGTAPACPAPKLRLESLERRENPATNIWLNVDNNYNNSANWSDGVPTPDDVLVFQPSSHPVPGSPPTPPVSTGTTFPTTASSFAGIRFENGYTGTVTFPVNISFSYYYQDCGITVQAANTTLTAFTTFIWTGGAVNYSSSPATYQLNGISVGQIGTDTSTLVSGSKIVLQKYGTVTVNSVVRQSGIVNLLNEREVDVLEDCVLIQQQVNLQMPPGGNKPDMNGNVLVQKGEFYADGGKVSSVKVDGGHLIVRGGDLEVTDKVPGTDWSVVMTPTDGGAVTIDNGRTLKVGHGFQMNCATGRLATRRMAEGPQTVTIEGKLQILNGEIALGLGKTGQEVDNYANLVVTEDAELLGGWFNPTINPTTGGETEFIKTEKRLNTSGTFTISPRYFLPGVDHPYLGGDWHVLRSELGFADGTNPTNGDWDHWTMYRSITELNWVVKWDPK